LLVGGQPASQKSTEWAVGQSPAAHLLGGRWNRPGAGFALVEVKTEPTGEST